MSRENRRARKIRKALVAGGYECASDWKATITDALADLRHLCDARNLDFGELDRVAYGHYSTERHAQARD